VCRPVGNDTKQRHALDVEVNALKDQMVTLRFWTSDALSSTDGGSIAKAPEVVRVNIDRCNKSSVWSSRCETLESKCHLVLLDRPFGSGDPPHANDSATVQARVESFKAKVVEWQARLDHIGVSSWPIKSTPNRSYFSRFAAPDRAAAGL
jgi:hypothetical protein